MSAELRFRVRSGGTVAIALDQCPACATKACIQVCKTQGGPLALDLAAGVPMLASTLEEVARGGCVECLGCELSCAVDGRGAVAIDLPVARFDEYLRSLARPPVYQEI